MVVEALPEVQGRVYSTYVEHLQQGYLRDELVFTEARTTWVSVAERRSRGFKVDVLVVR